MTGGFSNCVTLGEPSLGGVPPPDPLRVLYWNHGGPYRNLHVLHCNMRVLYWNHGGLYRNMRVLYRNMRVLYWNHGL